MVERLEKSQESDKNQRNKYTLAPDQLTNIFYKASQTNSCDT
jgi:hypothetical protein